MWDKLSDFQDIMKQAAEVGRKVKEIQEQLRQETVEASVGADLVTVKANGRGEILSVSIDPSLLLVSEREMLQELVTGAVNEAVRKAHELSRTRMASLTGGVDVAGMFGIS